MLRYLMTMPLNDIEPTNHGLVDIGDDGILVDCGTPVEDFGCYYISEDPLPTNRKEMFSLFLSLMK